MAFFDEISKKINSAGEGAKAFADVSRINSNIAEEEKKMNNLYQQIGKLYVSLHPQDYEENLGQLVSAVLASQEKINSLSQQIQNIKGIVKCENCGAQIPNNTAFCSTCGTPVPQKKPAIDENHMICGDCGAIIEKGVRFCTACGKPQVEPAPVVPVQEAPTPIEDTAPQEAVEAEKTERKCPACGSVVRENMKFCTTCGKAMDNSDIDVYSSSQSSDETVSETKVCPSCGAKVGSEYLFCVECGKPIN